MALLQIAEPGQSTDPHHHRLAVGIDLGTTNSLVATVRHSIPVVIDDAEGRSLLPSIVQFQANGTTEVGYAAQKQQAVDARNTVRVGKAPDGPRHARCRTYRKHAV